LIRGERPQSRFWVVGSGPLRRELEETAGRLGIEKATSFFGHQSDVAGIMAASDVIAMASVREGLPMVLLEALALARPVVATGVGGIPEVIQDSLSGWLVPPNAPTLLAERILETVEHPDQAAVVGLRGCARVSSEFSAHESARQVAQSYAGLVSAARTRGIEEIALENELGYRPGVGYLDSRVILGDCHHWRPALSRHCCGYFGRGGSGHCPPCGIRQSTRERKPRSSQRGDRESKPGPRTYLKRVWRNLRAEKPMLDEAFQHGFLISHSLWIRNQERRLTVEKVIGPVLATGKCSMIPTQVLAQILIQLLVMRFEIVAKLFSRGRCHLGVARLTQWCIL
jgi:hypothetical protein